MNRFEKLREWMFPAMLILFILQVMLLPVMIGLTYAVPAERPEHILTYKTGSLVWDKATSVRPDGSAELSFFETLYHNVNADNAEKVLAPGTEKDSVIRLKNDTNKEIAYTAVLYSLSTSPDLDIGATLSGNGFSDTSRYTLPENIKKETVVRAVGGKLDARNLISTGSGGLRTVQMLTNGIVLTLISATRLQAERRTMQLSGFILSSATVVR